MISYQNEPNFPNDPLFAQTNDNVFQPLHLNNATAQSIRTETANKTKHAKLSHYSCDSGSAIIYNLFHDEKDNKVLQGDAAHVEVSHQGVPMYLPIL